MMKSLFTLCLGLALCSALRAQVPSYVPTDGLVGWWPFNGNANDESGNSNDGVVNGATLTEDRFGNAESAFSFNGNASNIVVQNSQSLNPTEMSINVWIKPLSDNLCILKKSNAGNASEYGYGLTHNDYFFYQRGLKSQFGSGDCSTINDNDAYWSDPNIVQNNVWSMITTSIDADGQVSQYVNGMLVFTTQTTALFSCNSPTSTLRFGGQHWNGDPEWFLGDIDDIAIWNRALTPSEITQLYNAAEVPVAACTPLAPNLQNGLVGYWPFCGNANDESGNGNDGMVNGATLTEDRFGNANSAYAFDGLSNFIEINNNTSFDFFLNNSYTVNHWVRLNDLISTQAFIGQGDGEGQYQNRFWRTYLNQESINAHIRGNGSDPQDTHCAESVSGNFEWLMVSMIRNYNESLSLFINGSLAVTMPDITGPSNPFSEMRNILIGCFLDASSNSHMQFLNGDLDDIAIYNRALTPEEITQLYTGIAPCNLIASETQDTPAEVGGSAQFYVTLNSDTSSMKWQTNAANLGWTDVPDNDTYSGVQTQNMLVTNVSLANHEQPFRIIVSNSVCSDTSDVALLLVSNTCTAYDTMYTTIEQVVNVYDTTYTIIENVVDVFDTTSVINTIDVYDTLTVYNTIDVFDTTEFVVEVFDTLTNVVDVFDTTTVFLQVDIYDTLFIDVYDTTYVVNTIDVYDTTFVTVTDTSYIQVVDTSYVTVTDTLLIDITFVGFEGQPSWLNTLMVYPNPTSDHITIDYGNFELMAGYNTIITDAGGATVYSSAVNSQQAYIDINAWGAAGVYFMSVYDVNGVVVAVRQIVLE